MFFERRCPGCQRDARFVCADCWTALAPAPGRALFDYDDLGRNILLAAKNGGRRDLWRPLGRAVAQLVTEPIDLVTWVPASRSQLRTRGYDQGRLLARSVGNRLGVQHRRLMRRLDPTPQTGRDRESRLRGPVLRARGSVVGRVLVVDDVRTTGASLRAAAQVLKAAGAIQVTTVAVASVGDQTRQRQTDLR